MATIAQFEANRLNAQKSTGPRSAEGKASSRFNALKHGADARALIIPGEDEADLLDVTREYYEEFQPEGVVETELVDTLVRCHWEKHRVPRLEAAAIQALVSNQQSPDHAVGAVIIADALGPNVLQKLHRRSQAANRDWIRAESDLRRRQAERLSRPANPDPPAAAVPTPESARAERTQSGPSRPLAPNPRPLPEASTPETPITRPSSSAPPATPKALSTIAAISSQGSRANDPHPAGQRK